MAACIIIAKSRAGWSVNADADRVSDYASHEAAREAAILMVGDAFARGENPRLVDTCEERRDQVAGEPRSWLADETDQDQFSSFKP
jgi:hypothetical protein